MTTSFINHSINLSINQCIVKFSSPNNSFKLDRIEQKTITNMLEQVVWGAPRDNMLKQMQNVYLENTKNQSKSVSTFLNY